MSAIMLSNSIFWFITLTLTMATARSDPEIASSKNKTALPETEKNLLIGDKGFPKPISPPTQPIIEEVHEDPVDPEDRSTWFWLTGTDRKTDDGQSLRSIWELCKTVYKIFQESVKAHPNTSGSPALDLTKYIGNSSDGIGELIRNINNSKLTLDKLHHSLNISSQKAELSIWLMFICVLVYAEAF